MYFEQKQPVTVQVALNVPTRYNESFFFQIAENWVDIHCAENKKCHKKQCEKS